MPSSITCTITPSAGFLPGDGQSVQFDVARTGGNSSDANQIRILVSVAGSSALLGVKWDGGKVTGTSTLMTWAGTATTLTAQPKLYARSGEPLGPCGPEFSYTYP